MKRHPMQQDDITKALRLLARATERLKPYGTLMLTLQWLPKQRKQAGKKGDESGR